MAKALITGVNGFIGNHLIAAFLQKNWQVTGVGGTHVPTIEHNRFIYLDGGIQYKCIGKT